MNKVKLDTIISVFGLDSAGYTQNNVEFFNVNLTRDNLAFFDYNRLLQNSDPLSIKMKDKLQSYLYKLFASATSSNKTNQGLELLSRIKECNHTKLGYSEGKPNGNSLGKELKPIFLSELSFLKKAYVTDQISFNAIRLGIKKISFDRVSDICVSVVLESLIDFTNEQCIKHGVPSNTDVKEYVFDNLNKRWIITKFKLPEYLGKPIVFIPKKYISSEGKATCKLDQFIRFGFKNYIQNSPEVQALKKDGKLSYKTYMVHIKSKGIRLKDVSKELLNKKSDLLTDFESYRLPLIQEMREEDFANIVNA